MRTHDPSKRNYTIKATMTDIALKPTRFHIASRVAASLLGSYAFVWGFSTLMIASLVAMGVAYDQANLSAMLLAFIVFLIAFCWAFAARHLLVVWLVLAGGGGLMTGAAWLVQLGLA